MVRAAGSWRDVSRHFPSKRQLLFRSLGQQHDHEVLQRDHADAKLDQLGVVQVGYVGIRENVGMTFFQAVLARPSFIVPPGQRLLTQF